MVRRISTCRPSLIAGRFEAADALSYLFGIWLRCRDFWIWVFHRIRTLTVGLNGLGEAEALTSQKTTADRRAQRRKEVCELAERGI
jgi:hypothetical protein